MVYNVEPGIVDLVATVGDWIDLQLCITATYGGSPFALNRIRMQVRRKDHLLLKDWRSDITPPTISISDGCFRVQDTGFVESGFFDYDVEDTDLSGNVRTIMRGTFIVNNQITV